jgi:excisionase family DNA binding protein
MYTANELADLAGVSGEYVRRLCRDGIIPAKKHGRDWLIEKEDGDRWLRERDRET